MARIPLFARGTVVAHALVDDEDLELVAAYRWHRSDYGRAVRNTRPGERGLKRLLHRELFGLELYDPRDVHHRNEDPLDCRRANLRLFASRSAHIAFHHREGTGPARGLRAYREGRND